MTPTELDACQRVIEEDSFLMQMYMNTDKNLRVKQRVEETFEQYIKNNPPNFKFYSEIKSRLERTPQ